MRADLAHALHLTADRLETTASFMAALDSADQGAAVFDLHAHAAQTQRLARGASYDTIHLMFRTVELPAGVPGKLLLRGMPGWNEPFDTVRDAIVGSEIAQVVCLVPDYEIAQKSPDYARAIASGLPWRHVAYGVPDFGVPADQAAFKTVVRDTAAALQRGENIMVHCAAGIGRTGTFAVAVLCELGVALPEAHRLVKLAGSSAESPEQRTFLENLCTA